MPISPARRTTPHHVAAREADPARSHCRAWQSPRSATSSVALTAHNVACSTAGKQQECRSPPQPSRRGRPPQFLQPEQFDRNSRCQPKLGQFQRQFWSCRTRAPRGSTTSANLRQAAVAEGAPKTANHDEAEQAHHLKDYSATPSPPSAATSARSRRLASSTVGASKAIGFPSLPLNSMACVSLQPACVFR